MVENVSYAAELMWAGALAATLPALLIGLWARFIPTRPATRHAAWLVAIAWFALAPLVPASPFSLISWENLSSIASTNQDCENQPAVDWADENPSNRTENSAADRGEATEPTPPRTGARMES